MLPVLGREVIEGQEFLAVFFQTASRLGVFGPVGVKEVIKSLPGILFGFGHPYFLQPLFGLLLGSLGQFVQNIACFVYPTALSTGVAVDLRQGFPEAKPAVTDRQFWAVFKATPFEIEQKLFPGLLAFPVAIPDAHQLFIAFLVDSYDHQDALLGLVKTHLEMNAVRPKIYVALLG